MRLWSGERVSDGEKQSYAHDQCRNRENKRLAKWAAEDQHRQDGHCYPDFRYSKMVKCVNA